jgi:hypothetical protein
MSLSISIPKTAEQIPLDGLLTLTRTAIGLGVGILVADKIRRPLRQATAIALVSVGAIAAVPLLVRMALERINRPESERGSRNRLRSIRGDSGYPSETDVY